MRFLPIRPKGIILLLLFSCIILQCAYAEASLDEQTILEKMETAYARVIDYRTEVEIRDYRSDGSFVTQKFSYTFKKPNLIRFDFETPHTGMIVIFPDEEGKVLVRPSGFAGLLRFHLAPDNRLLIGDSRQRIDQTDLGLLIRNISHSLRDGKRGPASIAEEDGTVWIRVLAADHFRPDVVTLYRFFIDKGSWLPAKVEESTAGGYPEKTITFGGLEINTGIAESFFRLD